MIRPRTARSVFSATQRRPWRCSTCRSRQFQSTTSKANKAKKDAEPPDHRKLGVQQELFINSPYSPGSPMFLPNGTRIFNRLVDFLRQQYVRYGFEEVITPTIYKKALWAKSGHLENYADDMYSVTGYTKRAEEGHTGCCDGKHDIKDEEVAEDGEYGLKPMNCPGHCLIFASKRHSYRDLPVRYADFSPLHRNEISGALSGLTRVRRFHQDDGHIFCRPIQIESEIEKTLEFVKVVYSVLQLDMSYRLALSTRPKDQFIGTEEEWERAEASLKRALEKSGMDWSVNEGDGAFYGPKIDIILKDSDGKEHQTATVQLDFQLPKRFELSYQAPAPEYEARGETTTDAELLAEYGPVQPVMIHRAVLGSVERLLALLIEKHGKKWPFWLNPRQVMITTINDSKEQVEWAEKVRNVLTGNDTSAWASLLARSETTFSEPPERPTGLAVDIDTRAISASKKMKEAHQNGYNKILVIGDKEVSDKTVGFMKEGSVLPTEARDRLLYSVRTFQ